MVLYLSVVGGAIVIMTLVNSLFNQELFNCSPFIIFLIIVLGVVIEIALQGLVSYLAHCLPNKCFDRDKKFYKVSKREQKFYYKLRIKSWKDKVWELGVFSGFRKNKVYEPNSPEYLERFILECNKGFLGHFLGIFAGYTILFYPNIKFWFCVGLPIAIVNTFLCLLPCMVLRYNIPKLTIAYERAKKMKDLKEKEKENKDED